MNKVFFSLLVLAVGVGQAFASERIDLLTETFQNIDGTPEGTTALDLSQFDNPSGWTFTDAYAGPQCVIIKKGGTVTTPPIAGITGNAAFGFSVSMWEDPTGKTEPDWENMKPHALAVSGTGELSTNEFDGMSSGAGSAFCIYGADGTTRLTLTAAYDIALSGVSIYYGGLASGAMPTEDFTKYSHKPGEYYTPFDLTLTPYEGTMCYDDGKHNILIYTLDGSEPTRTSQRYDGSPIRISQTTTVRTATIFGDGYIYIDTPHTYIFPEPETPEIPAATCELTVSRPGNLKNQLLDLDIDVIEGLVLKGKINGADLKYLCASEGRTAKITYLDMEDVTFEYDGTEYRTEVYVPVGMGTTSTFHYYLSETNYDEHSSPRPSTEIYHCYRNNLASAFTDKSNVKRVVVPKILTSIGSGAFSGVTMATLPDGIEEIGSLAFASASNVNLPQSIRKIGLGAFGPNFIKSKIDLPNLEYIDDKAFEEAKISEFKFNDKLTYIGKSAFAGTTLCEAILSLPNDTIPEALFAGCKFLNHVEIKGNVRFIGRGAFEGSNNIKTFSLDRQNVEEIEPDAIPDYLLPAAENGIIYFGKAAYKRTENMTECTIKDGTVSLTDALFYGSDLASITLPKSLKIIRSSVFARTKLPATPEMSGVVSIGDAAFEYCSELGRVTIPESVERIGALAFNGCDAIWRFTYNAIDADCGSNLNMRDVELIIIGDKVRRLPKGLYTGKTNITEVILPSSVEILEPYAFYNCPNLTYVRLSDNITTISEEAFGYCTSLSDLHWPANLKTVGNSAFSHCNSLTTISLPEGTETIENGAFAYCENIETLYIASTINKIGYGAFDFDNRSKSTTITSTATEPVDYEWSWYYIGNPTVKVPAESVDRYKSHPKWSYCQNIISIEGISATTETSETSFVSGIDNDTDLGDTVIGNVYVTIGNEDGYDESDGSIVLNSTMDAEYVAAVGGMAPGASDIANRFNGLVVQVPAGRGTVTVNCLTVGSKRVAVKVGQDEPLYYTNDNKGDIVVDYNVSDDTYVYIYASEAEAPASAAVSVYRAKAPSTDNCIRLYSIAVNPMSSGVDEALIDDMIDSEVDAIYTINGIRVSETTAPGIYIVRLANGKHKKIIVK